MTLSTILPWLLVAQLLFSSSATSYVGYLRERLSPRKQVWGAILWGTSYWLKSALIAVAIIYGPEKHHWVVPYALAGGATFAIGDAGLLLLWSTVTKFKTTQPIT